MEEGLPWAEILTSKEGVLLFWTGAVGRGTVRLVLEAGNTSNWNHLLLESTVAARALAGELQAGDRSRREGAGSSLPDHCRLPPPPSVGGAQQSSWPGGVDEDCGPLTARAKRNRGSERRQLEKSFLWLLCLFVFWSLLEHKLHKVEILFTSGSQRFNLEC